MLDLSRGRSAEIVEICREEGGLVAVFPFSAFVVANRLFPPVELMVSQREGVEMGRIHDVGEEMAAIVIAFQRALEHVAGGDEQSPLLLFLLLQIAAQDLDSGVSILFLDLAMEIIDRVDIQGAALHDRG